MSNLKIDTQVNLPLILTLVCGFLTMTLTGAGLYWGMEKRVSLLENGKINMEETIKEIGKNQTLLTRNQDRLNILVDTHLTNHP